MTVERPSFNEHHTSFSGITEPGEWWTWMLSSVVGMVAQQSDDQATSARFQVSPLSLPCAAASPSCLWLQSQSDDQATSARFQVSPSPLCSSLSLSPLRLACLSLSLWPPLPPSPPLSCSVFGAALSLLSSLALARALSCPPFLSLSRSLYLMQHFHFSLSLAAVRACACGHPRVCVSLSLSVCMGLADEEQDPV